MSAEFGQLSGQPSNEDLNQTAQGWFAELNAEPPDPEALRKTRLHITRVLGMAAYDSNNLEDIDREVDSLKRMVVVDLTLPAGQRTQGQEDDLANGRRIVRLTYAAATTEYADRTQLEKDAMTGLLSTDGLKKRTARLLAEGPQRRAEGVPIGNIYVLYDDLTKFKDINDIITHNVGDECIREAAEELLEAERLTDLMAISRRTGTGDEFNVVLGNTTVQGAIMFVNRFHGLQLEKVRDDRYNDTWSRITQLRERAKDGMAPFEAVVRLEPDSQSRNIRTLYVNGERICPLRDIVVHAVGINTERLQSIDDFDGHITKAETQMEVRKAELHALMGGASR